ncbi:MAG: DUF4234 domain-containing protein [Clostridia bacterium]|nr:DUF4234 domain-containing protein [Clostridia bacterium]
MFCHNCGKQIEDGSAFCTYCGTAQGNRNIGQQVADAAGTAFTQSEQELSNAVNNVVNQNSYNASGYGATPLQENRSLVTYILLSIVTCGIYGLYFIYKMAQDVNVACEGDGESTPGLVAFILLSYLTCGFYSYYWYYKLGNRLQNNAPRYGMSFSENGSTVLMWSIFGSFICGLGVFVAMNILIKNSNAICAAYNRNNGM